MSDNNNNLRLRIFMTGVGGQGTLTATQLLAMAVLDAGLRVTAGEIHGMAQRGGVVESTVLIGCLSPKIGPGEADVLLAFEPTEAARALPYLKPGGLVLASSEPVVPVSVAMGKAKSPELDEVKKRVGECTDKAHFLPTRSLGIEAGAVQSGNISLLGAMLAMGVLPFGPKALARVIEQALPPKIVPVNLKALDLGVGAVNQGA